MAMASALVDSGATENFVDVRTTERWGMPRKKLFKPRPIVNVDGTENKAGAVTEACILEIKHQGLQKLQRFYVTDLGFDRVLLGYPWLSTFNPRIDWHAGTVEGRVILKTIANAWVRWKEL
jgi:predicted aspartyl protease